jgi:hypothetical protein
VQTTWGRSTLAPRFVDHGPNFATGQCLVFEQRLRYGLDIGPEVINEALDDGFSQR